MWPGEKAYLGPLGCPTWYKQSPLGSLESDFLWCPPKLPLSSFWCEPRPVCQGLCRLETTRLSCLTYFILPKIMSLLRRNTMETYNRHGGQALISQIMSVSLHSDATFIWRQKTNIQIWFNIVSSHKHFCHTWWKQRNLIFSVIPNICSMRIRKLSGSSVILFFFFLNPSICDDWSQYQVYQGTEESYRAFWNFLFEVFSICVVGLKG